MSVESEAHAVPSVSRNLIAVAMKVRGRPSRRDTRVYWLETEERIAPRDFHRVPAAIGQQVAHPLLEVLVQPNGDKLAGAAREGDNMSSDHVQHFLVGTGKRIR